MSLEVLRRLGHTDAHQLLVKDGSFLSYSLEDLPLGASGTAPGIRVNAAVVEGLAIGIDDLNDRDWPQITDPVAVLSDLIVCHVVFG